jgi:hypothetical protein
MGIEANRRWGVCSLNEFREVCDITFHCTYYAPCLLRVLILLQFLGLKRKHTISPSAPPPSNLIMSF